MCSSRSASMLMTFSRCWLGMFSQYTVSSNHVNAFSFPPSA
jgi:hypothetical protein